MNDQLRSSKSISSTGNVDMNVNVEVDVDAGAGAAKVVEVVKAVGDPSTGNEVAK